MTTQSQFNHSWSPWFGTREPVLAKNWGDPVKWDKGWNKAQYFTRIQGQPEPSKPTVFPSLCDWLDEEVPIEWTARFLGLIYDTPNLMWLLVTKRPENWSGLIQEVKRYALRKANPPREHVDASAAALASHWSVGDYPINVWIGASVEDQPTADRRIPELLKIPAAGRFLSLEPLLGPVKLEGDYSNGQYIDPLGGYAVRSGSSIEMHGAPCGMIDWLIIGGESGHGARPCNVDWIRSLVKQGREAGTATFVKQWGAKPSTPKADPRAVKSVMGATECYNILKLTHPKGGDPAEWPEDVRVREYPEDLR